MVLPTEKNHDQGQFDLKKFKLSRLLLVKPITNESVLLVCDRPLEWSYHRENEDV